MARCKCKICGESLLPKNAILEQNGNKKYFFCSQEHKLLFEQKSHEEKYLSPQDKARKDLEDFIWIELMNRQGNFIVIKKQLERYQKENGWRWSGMLYTAKYYDEQSEEPWNYEYGCGQIYECGWYEKAKEHLELIKGYRAIVDGCSEDIIEDTTTYMPIPKSRSMPLKMACEPIEDL